MHSPLWLPLRRPIAARRAVSVAASAAALTAAAPAAAAQLCRGGVWPPKSSIYLFRTDGMSCSRELVTGSGRITFAHPTTQQQLLVWRDRPRTVMVIKKLGKELNPHFFEVSALARRAACWERPFVLSIAAAAGRGEWQQQAIPLPPKQTPTAGCALPR